MTPSILESSYVQQFNSERAPAVLNEILRTVVGSGVHGVAIEGTDDHDEMGVYIQEQAQLLGLAPTHQTDTWRTQPEGARSGPGDIDLVRYSLPHFMRLAVKGNPSLLVPLFAPKQSVVIATELGWELQGLAPSIVSADAGWRFLGYLESQRERMVGQGKQNRVPKRPELIEKYGFDTKYASHAARLGWQGIELMETGRLTLPMADASRDMVRQIKTGGMSFKDSLIVIDIIKNTLEYLMKSKRYNVPAKPDMEKINEWMVSAHLRQWNLTPCK